MSSNLQPYQQHVPHIHPTAYVHPSAVIIGQVQLDAEASVWCGAVIRGDGNRIVVGAGSNIQDQCVLHADPDGHGIPYAGPLLIGRNVTVGHRALLHGCTIADDCLIGMGAILMNGVVVETNVIVGAGSLVPEGRRLEAGGVYVGQPARRVREVGEGAQALFAAAAAEYRTLAANYRATAG